MSSVRRKLFDQLEFTIPRTLEDVTRMLRRVGELLNPLLRNPIVNARIIEGVALVSGTNKVVHALGRPARGFFIMTSTVSSMGGIYSAQADNPNPDRTIWVVSSVTTTATLLVH